MNIFGNNIKFSIFGESHGVAIGGIIDGIKPGTKLDFEKDVYKRQPLRKAV